jgi:uracil phosphoribosyltransferase
MIMKNGSMYINYHIIIQMPGLASMKTLEIRAYYENFPSKGQFNQSILQDPYLSTISQEI